jgi:hypothetical protein
MDSLLQAAVNNEKNNEYSFFLNGDLCQMSAQRNFLSARGIQTKQNNVYPCLKQKDVPGALKIIWENNVEGWWHYEQEYVKHNICTPEDFQAKLNRL